MVFKNGELSETGSYKDLKKDLNSEMNKLMNHKDHSILTPFLVICKFLINVFTQITFELYPSIFYFLISFF